jgi:pyruvate-ferredoxin/flavodoxin oxidoreductase
LVCPHAAIRPNVFPSAALNGAPPTFKSVDARGTEFKGLRYSLQVAPEDCTGCGICVEICPAKSKQDASHKAINMAPQAPLRIPERDNFRFFLDLPEFDRRSLKPGTVKGSQFLTPLFEYSGACSGCGETPYLKLLSQLFGDRAVIANATGCSSIFGGNLPTTPWTINAAGQGPAWSNSLFEDAAEFGLGFRLSIDQQRVFAERLLTKLSNEIGQELVASLLQAKQDDEAGILAQRERVAELKQRLPRIDTRESYDLFNVADALVKRSVWIVGGDGWAYDIGYGGLDHVLASGHNVNVLVLDTEVYSNTGGQMSKSTPIGAVAKFAAAGKQSNKKDLGVRAMDYGSAYVATVAMGANDNHTVQAFVEAESYDGPSILIAYAHCIAHGIDMREGLKHQQAAVDCGHWPLYRYDPRRTANGLNPMQLDSRSPKIPFRVYAEMENRFRQLMQSDPQRAEKLLELAQQAAAQRYDDYARRAEPRPKHTSGA